MLGSEWQRARHILSGIGRDLRWAARQVWRSPGISALIIGILGAAIGAATTIFTFLNVLVLKTLPVPAPDELVQIETSYKGERPSNGHGYLFYQGFERESRQLFSGVLARGVSTAELISDGVHQRVFVEFVSDNYFDVLGVRPKIGRTFVAAHQTGDQTGAIPCVVSYRFWREQLREDPDILGRNMRLGTTNCEVIGVTEPRFHGAVLGQWADIQVPLEAGTQFGKSLERSIWLQMIGRLAPEVGREQAASRIQQIGTAVQETIDKSIAYRYSLTDGSHGLSDVRRRLYSPSLILGAAVLILLLISCANVGGLLSYRGVVRQFEYSLRMSQGASPTRLVRQTLIENLVLAGCGAVLGLLLAYWGVGALQALTDNGDWASRLAVSLDLRSVVVAVGMSIAVALVFGSVPALHAGRSDAVAGLREGGYSSIGVPGRGYRKGLIIAQVALSVAILPLALVFARSLENLETVDLGFDPTHVALLPLDARQDGLSVDRSRRMLSRILDDARQTPGVAVASLARISVLSGGMMGISVVVPGQITPYEETIFANIATPEYFKTLKMTLLRGRDFSELDQDNTLPVVIVNERFASTFWPDKDPIGQWVQASGRRQVIGVVQNASYQSVRQGHPPSVYLPAAQVAQEEDPLTAMTLHIRSAGDPAAALARIRASVSQIFPNVVMHDSRTLLVQRDQQIATERMMVVLSSLFAVFSTGLAVIGLGGLLSLSVATRRLEIGVRLALGASRRQIAAIFVRDAALLLGCGFGIGAPVAYYLTQSVGPLLFHVDARDSFSFAISVFLICLGSIVAMAIPVWRSMNVSFAVLKNM